MAIEAQVVASMDDRQTTGAASFENIEGGMPVDISSLMVKVLSELTATPSNPMPAAIAMGVPGKITQDPQAAIKITPTVLPIIDLKGNLDWPDLSGESVAIQQLGENMKTIFGYINDGIAAENLTRRTLTILFSYFFNYNFMNNPGS